MNNVNGIPPVYNNKQKDITPFLIYAHCSPMLLMNHLNHIIPDLPLKCTKKV